MRRQGENFEKTLEKKRYAKVEFVFTGVTSDGIPCPICPRPQRRPLCPDPDAVYESLIIGKAQRPEH